MEELIPDEGIFYAQIDGDFTTQDYRPYFRCLRLTGVLKESFDGEAFNEASGCPTFIIDLAWNGSHPMRNNMFRKFFWLDETSGENSARWLELKFCRSLKVTEYYAYEAFTDSEPVYLEVTSLNFVEGPKVTSHELATDVIPSKADKLVPNVELKGFHVGQGMCSLVSSVGHDHGYLLDAGGGTPVLRESYRNGKHFGGAFINELRTAIDHLQRITVVLSHADCDHWRILDWDTKLLKKVDSIYLPKGRPALVFNSDRVKLRSKGLGDHQFWLGDMQMDVLRSEPYKSDKNGHCLVIHIKQLKKSALLPGDYVYKRMLDDCRSDGAISALGKMKFDAVVVPHHGDKASAEHVFFPRRKDQSIAFFSAGDHEGYGHPTLLSIDAHNLNKFKVVDKLTPNIFAHKLLP